MKLLGSVEIPQYYKVPLSLEKRGSEMQTQRSRESQSKKPIPCLALALAASLQSASCAITIHSEKSNFAIQRLDGMHSASRITIAQHRWWVLYAFHLQNIIISRADSEAIHQTINAALLPNECLKSTCSTPYVILSKVYTELSQY